MDWSVSALSKLLRKSETSTAHTLLRDFMNEYRLGDLLARGAEDTDALLAIEQWLDWVRQIEGENAPMGIRKFVALLKQLEKTPILKAPLGDIIGHENCVQLLTIHAAKGLQFDTVFLIDLIRRPPPSSYLMQRLGGEFALKIPDADNETMETDRFQAIKAYHAEEEIEENKRLLYVALSRAENQLFVCLSQANAAKNNLQSLLLTCLDNYKDAFETISYENVEEKDQEKPRTDGESQEEIKFLGVKKSEEAPVVCNVSELETFALCPLKHHFSYTQQLSDEKWDAADQIDVTKMGTFLHSALNFLHGNPEMSSDEAIRKILINPILWGNEAAIAQLSDYLENYLKSPLYKKILSALEDYSELPFILESPSGKVRGQIDRLIRTDQGWTLIDFKLSSKKPTAADLLKDYDFQLKTYTLAAQRILKRTIPMVEIHLLGVPKLFRFEFSLEELNRHRIHIEDLLNRLKAPALDQVRFMDICRTCPFNRHVPICPVPAKPAA
jgi:ATP-dependent exoDNAse (exonuclease V) beta subunit